MERVWAPWRMEYINSADDQDGCIFCTALNSADDERYHVLVRRKNCFALMNKYPYNGGHLMVAPNEHIGELGSIAQDILGEMMTLTADCQKIIGEAMAPHGFNIGINVGRVAGAGIVDHLHIHIVPRWNGDTNFMPVLSDTKVIPQALSNTYALLMKKKRELFDKK